MWVCTTSMTAMIAHARPSNGWVWRPEPHFSTLWEETHLLVHARHGHHVDLPDNRITIYAR